MDLIERKRQAQNIGLHAWMYILRPGSDAVLHMSRIEC